MTNKELKMLIKRYFKDEEISSKFTAEKHGENSGIFYTIEDKENNLEIKYHITFISENAIGYDFTLVRPLQAHTRYNKTGIISFENTDN
jgi:hypothetical protein